MKIYKAIIPIYTICLITNAYADNPSGFIEAQKANRDMYIVQLASNEGGGNLYIKEETSGITCELKYELNRCYIKTGYQYDLTWTHEDGTSRGCYGFVYDITPDSQPVPAGNSALPPNLTNSSCAGTTPFTKSLTDNHEFLYFHAWNITAFGYNGGFEYLNPAVNGYSICVANHSPIIAFGWNYGPDACYQ